MSISLRTRRRWVDEAKEALRQTKEDTWRCHEAVDGKILTDKDYKAMVDSGIDPIDINRIFPVIGLLSGMQSINRRDIIAKGRHRRTASSNQPSQRPSSTFSNRTWPITRFRLSFSSS